MVQWPLLRCTEERLIANRHNEYHAIMFRLDHSCYSSRCCRHPSVLGLLVVHSFVVFVVILIITILVPGVIYVVRVRSVRLAFVVRAANREVR